MCLRRITTTDGAGRRHRVRLQRPARLPQLSDSGFVRPWKLPPLIELDTLTMVTDTVIAERRYIGSTQWQDSVLMRISTPSGYWDSSGRYHIAVHDFQGNIPAIVRLNADGSRQVVQQTHYYPYGATAANSWTADGTDNRYLYGGKELERTDSLDLYDFEARILDPTLGRFLMPDPAYGSQGASYGISPYAYAAANPLRFIDPGGERVYLYATELPGISSVPGTHTFIVVTEPNSEKVRGYYAYGYVARGLEDHVWGVLGQNTLSQVSYEQDRMIIEGKDTEHLIKRFEITPPEGMSDKEFDNKVIEVVKSFYEDSDFVYNLIPTDQTEGNCNSSTSTILIKAGVDKKTILNIKSELGWKGYGFDTKAKPWTKEERENVKISLFTKPLRFDFSHRLINFVLNGLRKN